MKDNVNFINKYFGNEGRFSNFVLRTSFVIVIAQQIYFPQEMKYFHLAILFMYMIFLEFFKDEHRVVSEEYNFTFLILGCSFVSIFDSFMSLNISSLYLVFLMFAIYFAFILVNRIFNIVRMETNFDVFTEANQKMLEKGTTFIKVLTLSIMGILFLSFLYVVYQFLKLLF